MSLITKPTISDIYSAKSAVTAHQLATDLLTGWELYFNRDAEAIFDDIAKDPVKALNFYNLVMRASPEVNAWLDAIGDDDLPTRAPTSLPAGWSFDGQSFSYNPPTE